ncbi:hypothetical protein [Methanolobus sp.]|jgi:hypothetical protein|uniref:hypothetical protein n=1 Tax=Methanolobus sp. TaxID=1874737 RepID=UPI0025D6F1E7|nr:hypothetical protein [Methanolobus sp.]
MDSKDDKGSFRVCLNCGYQRGFHVHFKEISGGKARLGLICPSCGQSYDIGWLTANITEMQPKMEDRYGELDH